MFALQNSKPSAWQDSTCSLSAHGFKVKEILFSVRNVTLLTVKLKKKLTGKNHTNGIKYKLRCLWLHIRSLFLSTIPHMAAVDKVLDIMWNDKKYNYIYSCDHILSWQSIFSVCLLVREWQTLSHCLLRAAMTWAIICIFIAEEMRKCRFRDV